MPQFIYAMKNLRKMTPQGKEILKGIWLSFYYGAKIGVIGHNGAGKSTLLRIMAGLDKDFDGEAGLLEGYTVGLLPQEPVLPAGKTVLECVEEAVAAKRAILNRYEELAANYSDETGRRVRAPAGPDRRPQPLGARPSARDRHGRAAPAAARPGGLDPLRRRAAPGGALPAAADRARPAAARRAHQPPRRRVGGLARAHLAEYPGAV